MAPCVPFVPASAMLVNIYLMLKLSAITWIRFSIWCLVGKRPPHWWLCLLLSDFNTGFLLSSTDGNWPCFDLKQWLTPVDLKQWCDRFLLKWLTSYWPSEPVKSSACLTYSFCLFFYGKTRQSHFTFISCLSCINLYICICLYVCTCEGKCSDHVVHAIQVLSLLCSIYCLCKDRINTDWCPAELFLFVHKHWWTSVHFFLWVSRIAVFFWLTQSGMNCFLSWQRVYFFSLAFKFVVELLK